MKRTRRVSQWLVVLWSATTAVLLLGIAIHILVEPGFPLGLGLVQTKGLAGLWVTLLPGTICLAALLLLGRARRLSAGLLMMYSAFWAVILGSFVPSAWRNSWTAGTVVASVLTPFLLVGFWCWSAFAAGRGFAGNVR